MKNTTNLDTVCICVVFFLIIVMFLMKSETFNNDLINYNGMTVRDLPDKDKAVMKFRNLNNKIEELIDKLITKYPDDQRVIKLKQRYNPNILSELPGNSNNTSYSVNKGDKLVICVRNKKNDNFIDDNTIFFVVLHELAHIMTTSIGHKTEFWDNFRFLLKHSIAFNLYKYQDFKNKPQSYCGINITDTPYTI